MTKIDCYCFGNVLILYGYTVAICLFFHEALKSFQFFFMFLLYLWIQDDTFK
jgi:hypothetical protein